jgi:hypothetical protein
MPASPDTTRVRIYGIRHHGPGSARRLLGQLRNWRPDIVLLECPADAQSALAHAADPGLVPPVAMLLYDPGAHDRAVHFPLAGFSPEWLTLRYADAHRIPVRCMDLPWGISRQLPEDSDREDEQDPFTVIAGTMGYRDTERWWEYYFEQIHVESDLFPHIQELMAAFRQDSRYGESLENRLREAWMRRTIRQAAGENHQRIAVVCGAFHTPALTTWEMDQGPDDALLHPWKGTPVQATWVPWTFGQLARRSGYGAGMLSPAWYELLYEQAEHPTRHWMARCARYLREKGLPAPPASIPAAVEMAESLATLRGMHQPGMDELEDAAVAVLVQGDPQWLRAIREDLLIGDRMGKVPPGIPRTPLQEDFQRAVRAARLSRAQETIGKVELELDLRKPTNRLAGTLLHRLRLLDLPWGRHLERGALAKGNFRERWRLEWKPSFQIRLLECGTWGLTLEEAARNYALRPDTPGSGLQALAERLQLCLQARLPQAAGTLAARLRDRSAESGDIWDLAATLTPLIQITRYGEAFTEDYPDLAPLLDHLIPRTLIGLPRAMHGLSEEQVQQAPDLLRQLVADLRAYGQPHWLRLLWQGLLPLTDDPSLAPALHAGLCRLAWEEGQIDTADLARFLRDALQPGQPAAATAGWVAGLLGGAEDLLLRHLELWTTLDHWVSGLPPDAFREALPALRKVFSSFSPSARRQIAVNLHRQTSETPRSAKILPELRPSQQDLLLPALRDLLWGPDSSP